MISIAFNIPRRNWYRVLSAPINEALKRGWRVTCLHGSEEKKPQSEMPLPVFSNMYEGSLFFKDYQGIYGFTTVLNEEEYDVVVDIDLLPKPVPELLNRGNSLRPLTVLLEGITHPRLQFGGKFPNFDLYLVPSKWHVDSTISIMTRDHSVVFADAEKRIGWSGKQFLIDWSSMFSNCWSEVDRFNYREKSVIVGTPSLDDLRLIDRSLVKKRLGIPLDVPVVGLLPSPWDMPMGYFWGDLNMVRNNLDIFRLALRYKKFSELFTLFQVPKDKDIVNAISQFCKKNGAFMVTKLRKHRNSRSYLARAADIVVGEDGYFPHTALEFFAISDICFGFCSSGAYECVAAGTPYVDINLPYFPKKELIKLSSPSTAVALPWKGVVTEIAAEKAINQLPLMGIDDFAIDSMQRTAYLEYFTSGIKGNHSEMMMDAIIHKLRGCPR